MTTDFQPSPQTWYILTFEHSGRALTVADYSSANGGNVEQQSNRGQPNQQWRFEQVESGWYMLVARHSGKALDVSGNSTANGANVHQWTVHREHNQQWRLVSSEGGFLLESRKSGKLLDVSSASEANEANVQQYGTSTQPHRRLRLHPIITTTRPQTKSAFNFYRLRFKNSPQVLGIVGGEAEVGARVELQTAGEGEDQLWMFEEKQPGWFYIQPKGSVHVLDVKDSDDATIHLWERAQHHDKLWSVTPVGDAVVIRSKGSGKVLSAVQQGSTTSNDFAIEVTSYAGMSSQEVVLEQATVGKPMPVPGGWYRMNYRSRGECLGVGSTGLGLQTWTGDADQHFALLDAGSGSFHIRVRATGKVLSVVGASKAEGAAIEEVALTEAGPEARWNFMEGGVGSLAINVNSNKWLRATDAGLVQGPSSGDGLWAMCWDIELAEEPAFVPEPGAWYALVFVHSDKVLAVRNSGMGAGVDVGQAGPDIVGYPQRHFRFEDVGGGYYEIVARHSGLVLEVKNGSDAHQAEVQQNTRNGWKRQQWSFRRHPRGLRIVNRATGKGFGVQGRSDAKGATVYQVADESNVNQGLRVVRVPADAWSPEPGQWYALRFAHSNRTLEWKDEVVVQGATQYKVTSKQQHWRFEEVEAGWYRVFSRKAGKVLEYGDGDVGLAGAGTAKRKQWALLPTPSGYALLNRQSDRVLEVTGALTKHVADIRAVAPVWSESQSVRFEPVVSEATLAAATPTSLPEVRAQAIGEAGESDLGAASGDATTSEDQPSDVADLSPFPVSLGFVQYSLPIVFEGEVSALAYSGGATYTGRAALAGPFDVTVDPIEVMVATTSDKDGTERKKWWVNVGLPQSRSLAAVFEGEVLDAIDDAQLRSAVDSLLMPYVNLYENTTILLASDKGIHPTYGAFIAGFNAFATLTVSSIPPFDLVHDAFPELGLDQRTLVLGVGTGKGENPPLFVSAVLKLDVELGHPSVVLNRMALSVLKEDASTTVGAVLGLTLNVQGEALLLRGGISNKVNAKPNAQGKLNETTVWAALDTEDGAWEKPFGVPGLTIGSMGVEIGPGPDLPSVAIRGELHLGEGLFGGRVGIKLDPDDPTKNILDIYSEEGIQLPRLLSALTDGWLDVSGILDINLTNVQLYIAPSGGKIAGQVYKPGFSVGASLELWGYGATIEGTLTDTEGGTLIGELDPIVVRVGNDPYLRVTGSGGTGGPSLRMVATGDEVGASADLRVQTIDGTYVDFSTELNARGFSVALSAGGEGLYAGASVTLEDGLFRLACTVDIEVAVPILNHNVELSVACTIESEVTSERFSQRIRFEFEALGERYAPGPFNVDVPFEDIDDVIAAFREFAADLLGGGVGEELAELGEGAVAWVESNVTRWGRDAARELRELGGDVKKIADGLKADYDAGAEICASFLRDCGWAVSQAGDYLDGAFDLSDDELGEALKEAGYSVDETKDWFEKTGRSIGNWANSAAGEVADWFSGW